MSRRRLLFKEAGKGRNLILSKLSKKTASNSVKLGCEKTFTFIRIFKFANTKKLQGD